MAVYGYARVSTQDQINGTSLDEQARRIRGVAQALGLSDPEVIVDAGVSGSVPLDLRPHAGPLLERLNKGDTLIVMKMDRAFRNAEDALVVSRTLGDRGVDLIVANIGLDPIQRDGLGKLMFTMLAAIAEMERFTIRERVRNGMNAKASFGGYTGGRVPFGYRVEGQGKDSVLVEDEEEQAVITVIKDARARGLSLRATADHVFERMGVKMDWNAVRRVVDRLAKEEKE